MACRRLVNVCIAGLFACSLQIVVTQEHQVVPAGLCLAASTTLQVFPTRARLGIDGMVDQHEGRARIMQNGAALLSSASVSYLA